MGSVFHMAAQPFRAPSRLIPPMRIGKSAFRRGLPYDEAAYQSICIFSYGLTGSVS